MKSKNNKGLFWSIIIIILFAGLMLFGLKQNANFTPSALVGQTVPEFEADLFPLGKFNSKKISGTDSWTVINFWASTCYVCREEAQELENFYQNVSLLSPDSPKFVSINIQENVEDVGDWQRNFKQTFPVVLDKKGHISILFGVTGTPETFLIDPNGIVRYRIAGAVNTNYILSFIEWFEKNPTASEKDARLKFVEAGI